MTTKKKEYSKDKVIFLDIDGVLATERMHSVAKKLWYSDRAYPFEKHCVKALNQVIEKTNPLIVLSSDWRRVFSLEEINEIFCFNKVLKGPSSYTQVLHNREKEIRKYVKDNRLSKFVIIDDAELNCYKERFVRTNAEKGLQINEVKRIVKLLR